MNKPLTNDQTEQLKRDIAQLTPLARVLAEQPPALQESLRFLVAQQIQNPEGFEKFLADLQASAELAKAQNRR